MAKFPLILRLEDARGNGVYSYHARMGIEDYWGDKHPGPYSDGIKELTRDHIFGFAGQYQARRWFYNRDDLRYWHNDRDVLWLSIWPQSTTEDILRGRHQIAFIRPNVAPLRLPPTDIHDLSERELQVRAEAFF